MAEEKISQTQGAAAAGETIQAGELDSLLTKAFKPKSDQAKESITKAVNTLAEQALAHTALISEKIVETIKNMVSAIDKKLTEQINHVLHNEEFRKLEATWRGLDYLVNNTETDEKLKLRVLNISKNELGKTIKAFKGTAWDQSPLFKKFYEEEFGTAGGEPIGCIIGDYFFDHSAPDLAILSGMSQIAAAAHAPFLTSIKPTLFNIESWQELANPRDLTKIFSSPEYAAWKAFRKTEDAKYVGFVMPRTLARLPYNEKDNPVEEFSFTEDTAGAVDDRFVWSNAAYAMGVNINKAFKLYGWCTAIRGVEGGGMVSGLPVYTFKTDDGGVAMKCPTEIAITDRREAELSKNGFLPLIHWKNTNYAAFIGAQSAYEPTVYDDPDATANANLSARLPYMFAMSRFAHYLKCMVRDKIGSFASRDDIQKFLGNWINNYVTLDPNATQSIKARFPLSAAEIKVEEDPSNPGYYKATFYLKPHYQLEGLTVSLRLVTKLPSQKK